MPARTDHNWRESDTEARRKSSSRPTIRSQLPPPRQIPGGGIWGRADRCPGYRRVPGGSPSTAAPSSAIACAESDESVTIIRPNGVGSRLGIALRVHTGIRQLLTSRQNQACHALCDLSRKIGKCYLVTRCIGYST
jgi:hypothetical protein